MSKIFGDIEIAFIGGANGAVEAIDNAPVYAKLPLLHATGVVGAGVYSGGVLATGVVLSHPVETSIFLTESSNVVNDIYNSSMPPTTGLGSMYNLYIHSDEIMDNIQNMIGK